MSAYGRRKKFASGLEEKKEMSKRKREEQGERARMAKEDRKEKLSAPRLSVN